MAQPETAVAQLGTEAGSRAAVHAFSMPAATQVALLAAGFQRSVLPVRAEQLPAVAG